MRNQICFVCPPGAAIERPAIGLGILTSVLTQAGLIVTTKYENLRYAELVGLDIYSALLSTDPKIGLMDWIFAGAAFPQFAPDHDSYIARVFATNCGLNGLLTVQDLLELRRTSGAFVTEAVRRIVQDETALVGCSSSFCQHVASLALLRKIRAVAPTVTTMIGGANCEPPMGGATHELFTWVDFVVSGDAEQLILPLVNEILSCGRAYSGPSIPGVLAPADRHAEHVPQRDRRASSRAVVRSMSDVPLPAYEEYFSQIRQLGLQSCVEPGLLFEASRGCWWGERSHCSFCGLNGGAMTYSSKNAASVLSELAAMTRNWGISRIAFVDNILDHGYMKSLVPWLADLRAPYQIFVEIKANLRREQVALLARAGIRWIQPGIESLDSRVLRLMKKGSSAWQNVLLLKWCRQFGVRLFWNIIVGTPGEEDTWYETQALLIPLLAHCQPALPVELQYCRFSPYCENPAAYGLELAPTAAYRYIFPVDDEDLRDLVYFFDATGDPASSRDPAMMCVGKVSFFVSIARWRESWAQGIPPVCQRAIMGRVRGVRDTRWCALNEFVALSECEESVLDECEDGPSISTLQTRTTEGRRFSLTEVNGAMNTLGSRGFLVTIDKRILSLVHPETIPPLPDQNEFPGGYLRE